MRSAFDPQEIVLDAWRTNNRVTVFLDREFAGRSMDGRSAGHSAKDRSDDRRSSFTMPVRVDQDAGKRIQALQSHSV